MPPIDLSALPSPPPGRVGWPWTEGSPPIEETDSRCPSISIIVPSLNQGVYLEETLRSILLQGYPDLEVIVCDGGSTDSTPGILDRYAAWLQISVEPEDGGQSAAINRGFAAAEGDIITWISSDDVYQPGAFLRVSQQWAAADEAAVMVGGFVFLDEASTVVGDPIAARLDCGSPADLSRQPLGSWRLHQVATFFSTRALDRVGREVREDLRYTMDRELLYRVLRMGPAILVDGSLASFRRHTASKSVGREHVLEFFAEYDRLQQSCCDGDAVADAQRRRIGRHYLSKGWLRWARLADSRTQRLAALARAVWLRPGLLLRFTLWKRSIDALGLRRLATRLGTSKQVASAPKTEVAP